MQKSVLNDRVAVVTVALERNRAGGRRSRGRRKGRSQDSWKLSAADSKANRLYYLLVTPGARLILGSTDEVDLRHCGNNKRGAFVCYLCGTVAGCAYRSSFWICPGCQRRPDPWRTCNRSWFKRLSQTVPITMFGPPLRGSLIWKLRPASYPVSAGLGS
jgi:hypothetical protein